MFNRKFFKYNPSDAYFLLLYILIFVSCIASVYRTLSIPKINENVVVLYKTSGTDKDGKMNYFADVQDSSKKIWTENIKFGFEYDSLKIGSKIVVQKYQQEAMIFCGLSFLALLILTFGIRKFFEIISGMS